MQMYEIVMQLQDQHSCTQGSLRFPDIFFATNIHQGYTSINIDHDYQYFFILKEKY